MNENNRLPLRAQKQWFNSSFMRANIYNFNTICVQITMGGYISEYI